jgi:hypothetical protein
MEIACNTSLLRSDLCCSLSLFFSFSCWFLQHLLQQPQGAGSFKLTGFGVHAMPIQSQSYIIQIPLQYSTIHIFRHEVRNKSAPLTVPLAVIRGPKEFENFPCHRGGMQSVTVVTLCPIYIIPQLENYCIRGVTAKKGLHGTVHPYNLGRPNCIIILYV